MAGDRDSIIRKLKKLRAKAESAEAIGSEAEAQSFAEMIQRMLSQHKVDESELDEPLEPGANDIVRVWPEYHKHGIKIRNRRIDWLQTLASVVAWGHYCQILVHGKTSGVTFVGKKIDAEIAADVYLKLIKTAESIADKEYVKYFYECKEKGSVQRARGFRQSFLMGFSHRIGRRYFEYMEEIRKYYASNQKSLVVLEDSRKRVKDFLDTLTLKTDDHKIQRIENHEGFVRGVEKANEVELSGNKTLS